ncbi:MAG: AMP-binding protein, partial [Verrucomicrobiota bacterium]|nr:AMP-binding protein [Verrucomicrobiota bacterium]
MKNLANRFNAIATENSEKTAIYWGEEQYTFGQAHGLAARLAKRLREEYGLQPGDRVGLWLKNCPEFVFSLFGILLAEGVVVSINNFLTPDEVGYILGDSQAKVLISEASMADGTTALRAQLDGLAVIEIEELAQSDAGPAPELSPAGQSGEELALIIYTSGTTGKPKGAMLSNNNLLRNVEGVMAELELTADDRMACLLPMFHSFSMTVCVLLPMTQ